MNRAEMRRQKKQQAKMDEALKKAGFPGFQMPAAPVRVNGLSDQEVANLTGAKVVALENWRREQTETIKKALKIEAQEKLDRAEEYITFYNVLTSLKALDGFRYAKAAATYLIDNYSKSIIDSKTEGSAKKLYKEIHEKYGIEFEFDEPNLNEDLGYGDVDWMTEYIGQNIPYSVYQKIWNDSRNIQSVMTRLVVLWELCEEFGFAKTKKNGTMLNKFILGTKKKYDQMDSMEHPIRDITKLLEEKYDIEVDWGSETQKTLERFDC